MTARLVNRHEREAAISLQERLGLPPVGQSAMSHDRRYRFFCLVGDMYWVDAGFPEGVRQKRLEDGGGAILRRPINPVI